jgi:hypothetical protein
MLERTDGGASVVVVDVDHRTIARSQTTDLRPARRDSAGAGEEETGPPALSAPASARWSIPCNDAWSWPWPTARGSGRCAAIGVAVGLLVVSPQL